jgi:hypothetical protein
VGLYPEPVLVDDLRRLRIRESVAGWKLDPPKTASGHGDAGIAFAMALWMARQDPFHAGDWTAPPAPTGHERSFTQQLHETEGVFADPGFAPFDEAAPWAEPQGHPL